MATTVQISSRRSGRLGERAAERVPRGPGRLDARGRGPAVAAGADPVDEAERARGGPRPVARTSSGAPSSRPGWRRGRGRGATAARTAGAPASGSSRWSRARSGVECATSTGAPSPRRSPSSAIQASDGVVVDEDAAQVGRPAPPVEAQDDGERGLPRAVAQQPVGGVRVEQPPRLRVGHGERRRPGRARRPPSGRDGPAPPCARAARRRPWRGRRPASAGRRAPRSAPGRWWSARSRSGPATAKVSVQGRARPRSTQPATTPANAEPSEAVR